MTSASWQRQPRGWPRRRTGCPRACARACPGACGRLYLRPSHGCRNRGRSPQNPSDHPAPGAGSAGRGPTRRRSTSQRREPGGQVGEHQDLWAVTPRPAQRQHRCRWQRPGYQRSKRGRSVPSRARVRVCNSRCVQHPVEVGEEVLLDPRGGVRRVEPADAQHRGLEGVEALLGDPGGQLGAHAEVDVRLVGDDGAAGTAYRLQHRAHVERRERAQVDDLQRLALARRRPRPPSSRSSPSARRPAR